MKKIFLLLIASFICALIFVSCKKEYSCEDCREGNKPPVANAGRDTTIVITADSIVLDGSTSFDPDGSITEYFWAKISGPSSFAITNSSSIQAVIKNLAIGKYQFELKVTDNGGLSAKDTVQITVIPSDAITNYPNLCGDRPVINARLVPMGTLSLARSGMMSATAGNKILFAGGYSPTSLNNLGLSSRVDIYDISTNTWSTTELREDGKFLLGITIASVGNKILFAGGFDIMLGEISTSRVDIYDVSTKTWSSNELSQPSAFLVSATLGNKIYFTGTEVPDVRNGGYKISKVVEIYDNTSNSLSTDTLSEGRMDATATTIGNKIYFAGGHDNATGRGNTTRGPFKTVDVYDGATNSWSISSMSVARYSLAGIPVGNNIYWAGGYTSYPLDNPQSTQVEIRDVNTGTSSITCMDPGSYKAIVKDDNIVFFNDYVEHNDNRNGNIQIYNTTTNTWLTGVLNQKIYAAAIISVNNIIYVAGGTDFSGKYFNQVWKLEF
jgi:N-acetylneuraminic acid mutarotase